MKISSWRKKPNQHSFAWRTHVTVWQNCCNFMKVWSRRSKGLTLLPRLTQATIGKMSISEPLLILVTASLWAMAARFIRTLRSWKVWNWERNAYIYPNVSIYQGCKIGNNVILHSGSVIGADGFGFAPNPATNSYDKIPQIGIVTIEDNVEIGANTCVDPLNNGQHIRTEGCETRQSRTDSTQYWQSGRTPLCQHR